MKKYVQLRCSSCTRQKDSLIDLTHYAPDRCTITLGCEGRLSPVGYTSDGSTLLGVPPTGLSNWYPRGSAVTTTKEVKADSLYDTSTGTKNQIVLAIPHSALTFVPAEGSTVQLTLEAEQQTAKDYRQYTYRRSSAFTVINGVEDNQAKKVLRYGNTDQVEVYVNGVKRVRDVDYKLYDGSVGSAVPPNSVLFTSVQTGASTQVDVIVTKAAAVSTVSLQFTRAIDDEDRVNIGAWEGVSQVTSPAVGDCSLFYCDFAEDGLGLALDVKLRFSSMTIKEGEETPELPLSSAAILLSRAKLYTQVDRHRSKWIPVNLLNTNTDYMVVKLVDSERRMLVTERSVVDLYPALAVIRFDAHKLQTKNLAGDADAAELDNALIIGPDA